jgi:hypothetical protein
MEGMLAAIAEPPYPDASMPRLLQRPRSFYVTQRGADQQFT